MSDLPTTSSTSLKRQGSSPAPEWPTSSKMARASDGARVPTDQELQPFSDAWNDRQDKWLNENRKHQAYLTVFTDDSSLLLASIMRNNESERPDSARAMQLLEDYPDLQPLLSESVQTRKYGVVRNHKALRGGFAFGSRAQGPIAKESDADMDATKKAFLTPFQGSYHVLLRDTLNDMNTHRSDAEYANFLPIVQSSGMGKSRTVDETAKLIFTLPFNLRHVKDNTGYPTSDKEVVDFFLAKGVYETVESVKARYHHLLENVFNIVGDEISKMDSKRSYEEFAAAWREHLDHNLRCDIYKKAIKEATDGTKSSAADKNGAEDSNKKEAEHSSKKISEGSSAAKTPQDACHDACRNLLDAIDTKSGRMQVDKTGSDEMMARGPVRLLLYFDESHILNTMEYPQVTESASGESRTAYQILCSALGTFTRLNVFCVFLSTNSNLSRLSPAHYQWWSARTRMDKDDHAQAPFVELPFDVWKGGHGIFQENQHTLEEISRPSFMVRFGRPLFWTRYETNDPIVQSDIIEFAKMKLNGTSDEKTNEDGNIAALAMRILLDFEPSRVSAVLTENRLVEGHMRVAYSVPQHREYLRSGAPSEPILAEAAARIMNNSSNKRMDWAQFLTRDWLQKGLISKGDVGELAMRLILILAHDRAIERMSLPDNGTQSMYSRGIPLAAFIRALLSDTYAGGVLDARPDNMASTVTMVDAFPDAVVFFNQIVKAKDGTIVTDEAAAAAMARGIAFMCGNTQAIFDYIIPVLLDKNKKLARFVMSALFVQVKNCEAKLKPRMDCEKTGFFTPGNEEANTRPYITIVAQLGVQHRTSRRNPTASNNESDGPTTPPQRSSPPPQISPSHVAVGPPKEIIYNTRKPKRLPHPRYSFDIIGCSSTVYGVVEENQKASYAQLLKSRDFISEHPRQSKDAIDAVLRLKPLWSTKFSSFHWYVPESDYPTSRLNFEDDEMEPDDGVKVHSYGEPDEAEGEVDANPMDID